jgi:inosine-uridine nucleoside N-ribohydrolase
MLSVWQLNASKEHIFYKEKFPIRVIFETDLGNDVDDVLALDMLDMYMKEGKVNLLAICSNKDNKYSSEFIDIMNTWTGNTHIPIGIIHNGPDCENDAKNYAQCVADSSVSGHPLFRRSIADYKLLPDATELYRKILSKQPDHSVVIISTGFSTNLARLLETKPDKYSSLSGQQLIAKKVRVLSVMAGSYGEKKIKEYNVIKDVKSAKEVFSQWPTRIVDDPFEIGIQITYPAKSIENGFKWDPSNPVVSAYKCYMPMPYDRPTWDLCAVLYAIEPNRNYFSISQPGKIRVDNKGYTHFTKQKNGNCFYLSVSPKQAKRIRTHFIQLITADPRRIKNKKDHY